MDLTKEKKGYPLADFVNEILARGIARGHKCMKKESRKMVAILQLIGCLGLQHTICLLLSTLAKKKISIWIKSDFFRKS